MSPGDILCIANSKRLLPGSTFEEFVQRIKNDPQFKAVAEKAREAIQAEMAYRNKMGMPLPVMVPSNEIAETSAFGHIIYSKCGVLSDSEVVKLCGKTAKDLNLKAFSSEFCSVKGETSFYLISLQGLPPDLLQTIRKMKLYHSVGVRNDRVWLNADTQLSKGQGADVSQHLAQKYGEKKRPAGLVNHSTSDTTTLQTLEDLQQIASLLENQRKENLQKDASGPAEAPEPVGPVVKMDPMVAALGDDDEKAPKKRKAAKRNQASSSALPSASASASAAASAVPKTQNLSLGDVSSVKSENSSKKAKMQAQQFELLDEEMKKVAMYHVANQGDKKNTSFKSLQYLTPQNFMTCATDHNKGHCIPAVAGLLLALFCCK